MTTSNKQTDNKERRARSTGFGSLREKNLYCVTLTVEIAHVQGVWMDYDVRGLPQATDLQKKAVALFLGQIARLNWLAGKYRLQELQLDHLAGCCPPPGPWPCPRLNSDGWLEWYDHKPGEYEAKCHRCGNLFVLTEDHLDDDPRLCQECAKIAASTNES
jgi:hypothetical protein